MGINVRTIINTGKAAAIGVDYTNYFNERYPDLTIIKGYDDATAREMIYYEFGLITLINKQVIDKTCSLQNGLAWGVSAGWRNGGIGGALEGGAIGIVIVSATGTVLKQVDKASVQSASESIFSQISPPNPTADMYFDKVTMQTNFTDTSYVTSLANSWKSQGVSCVEIYSPVGNYIAQFKYDKLFGDSFYVGTGGNDTLIGNIEDDIFIGGDGDDHYESGGGNDVIYDIDGKGSVKIGSFGGTLLTGGSKYPTETVWKDGGITYQWAGTGVSGESHDLTVKNGSDTLTITNFHNGDLGINLKMEEVPPLRGYTTAEANALWYDSLTFWKLTNSPYYSSQNWHSTDTLPWNISLYNIEVDPDGAGNWVIDQVWGSPPGLTCPLVSFAQVAEIINAIAIYNNWKQAYPEDPIILDLDKDGVELVSTSNGVYFDLDNSGFAEKTAWVGSDDAVLVLDRNENGIIDNGSELFTFETLAELDTNSDGIIDENDTEFANLKVLKGDGNLLTLEEAGIKSLNLTYTTDDTTDENGNARIGIGSFTLTDDTTSEMSEFNLNRNPVDSQPLEWVDVPVETALLPDIEGIGNTYSLQQAMTRDESGELKALIQEFIDEENLETRNSLIDQILYKWTGVENVDPESRGDFDARKLGVLESFMGTYFEASNTSIPDNIKILKFNKSLTQAA